MRKSKRGKALFDLLTEDNPEASGAIETPPGKGLRGQVVHAPEMQPHRTGGTGYAALVPLQPGSPRGSVVELEGERVRLTLTSWTAAFVAFVGIVLVVGAFELGRRLGDGAGFDRGHASGREAYLADTRDEIETARQQPPATDLISSLLLVPEDKPVPVVPNRAATRSEQPAEKETTRPLPNETRKNAVQPSAAPKRRAAKSQSSWIRGYTYIVAQEFAVGNDEDANRAQDFLTGKGVRTDLIRYPSGSMQLITLQGYNRDDSTQKRMSQKLLDKVHAAGRSYFAQRGGYKLEGYFKKLKGESW